MGKVLGEMNTFAQKTHAHQHPNKKVLTTKSQQRPCDTCFRMGHRVSPNRPATKLETMFPIPSLQWKKPAIICKTMTSSN